MQETKRSVGVQLVAFAVMMGVALRRVRLESGLVQLDVWQPEEGGWQPMRREVVVMKRSIAGGGVEHVESERYPDPFGDLLDDPTAWSPRLPDAVMVDVLEAQVDSLRDTVGTLREECEDLCERARKDFDEKAELRQKLADSRQEAEATKAQLQTLQLTHARVLEEKEAWRRDAIKHADSWTRCDAQLVDARAALDEARALVREASLALRRLSRQRDASRARRDALDVAETLDKKLSDNRTKHVVRS